MSKIYIKSIAIYLFVIFAFASTSWAQTTLRLAFQLPLNHYLAENIASFKTEVEARSNGKIQIAIRDYGSFLEATKNNSKVSDETESQQYFKDKEIMQAVSEGVIEAGLVSLPRFAEVSPLVDIFYQPFLLDTERKLLSTTTRDSPVRKAIETSIAKAGSKVLWWQSYGNVILVSNGETILRPDHIKDKRVRVFGETLGNLVLASGGEPFAISNSQQAFAYKHKKVEVGMTTISEISRKKIWEVMDTISLTNNANIQFITIVNSRWWSKLNQFNKKVILDAALNAENRSIESIKKIEADSYKEVLENGMKLVILSDDDRNYWKEKSEPIYKNFLEKTGEEGMELFLLINNF